MGDILSPRRYYLAKRVSTRIVDGDLGFTDIWRAKQEAEPGTALPATFPFRTELAAIGYTTKEDLDGSDADELVRNVRLSRRDADAVLAAWAAL